MFGNGILYFLEGEDTNGVNMYDIIGLCLLTSPSVYPGYRWPLSQDNKVELLLDGHDCMFKSWKGCLQPAFGMTVWFVFLSDGIDDIAIVNGGSIVAMLVYDECDILS